MPCRTSQAMRRQSKGSMAAGGGGSAIPVRGRAASSWEVQRRGCRWRGRPRAARFSALLSLPNCVLHHFPSFAGLLNRLHRTATAVCKDWDKFTLANQQLRVWGRQKGWPHEDAQQTARSASSSLHADVCGGTAGAAEAVQGREEKAGRHAGWEGQRLWLRARQVAPEFVKHALMQLCMFHRLTFDGSSGKALLKG